MKNEKNMSQDKDQVRNQQGRGTETEQRNQDQKLKKEQRTGREESELEDQDFDSELEEGDDVEQGRAGDKFGKQQGRQQDPTKSQQPVQKRDEYQGGSGKGIDVD